MILGIPLFIGESSIDHLIEIIKVMGTPTKTQVIDMNP
jgi:glycogen synthase kinase 3 beta